MKLYMCIRSYSVNPGPAVVHKGKSYTFAARGDCRCLNQVFYEMEGVYFDSPFNSCTNLAGAIPANCFIQLNDPDTKLTPEKEPKPTLEKV